MKVKVFLSIMLVMFFFVSFTYAEETTKPTTPVLKAGDVERFIKTFPQLRQDLENFGFKYEAKEGDMNIPEALQAKDNFLDILKKHGWDDKFFEKLATILLGYSYLQYGKEITKAEGEMEKSLKEIESNPNIPEDTKKQLKEQLLAAKGMMKTESIAVYQSLHPQDVELIKPFVEQIKKIVDEKEK